MRLREKGSAGELRTIAGALWGVHEMDFFVNNARLVSFSFPFTVKQGVKNVAVGLQVQTTENLVPRSTFPGAAERVRSGTAGNSSGRV